MTDQTKIDILEQISVELPQLRGHHDQARRAFVWNCGNRQTGNNLGGKVCHGLAKHGLRVVSPDSGPTFAQGGASDELLFLKLDAIVELA